MIIAGGLGTRLRPITLHRPKALLPMVDRPQIAHILDALPKSCDEVFVAVSYRYDQVRAFFRSQKFGVDVHVVEEPEPLGTAGAIKSIEHRIRDTFAVYNGDVVDSIDFDGLVAAHRSGGGIATIALWPVEDPSAFGVVGLDKDRIVRFVEKPAKSDAPSNLVNAGRYVFDPRVFDFIEAGRAVSLESEVFPRLVEEGIVGYRFDGYWSDAGTLASYLRAQRLLLDAGRGRIFPDADVASGELRPPLHVGPGCLVHGAVGPHAVFVKGCRIGRAHVRDSALFENVSVDDKAEVLSSILGARVAIGEGAIVRDSILADGVQVPPRATIVDERVIA